MVTWVNEKEKKVKNLKLQPFPYLFIVVKDIC